MVQNFFGIMKAYSTRVGGGPFPTEQDNDIGNYIRERGNEYGTTTRRPRRCGWFDASRRQILRRSLRHHPRRHDAARRALRPGSRANLHRLHASTASALDYFRADMDTLAEVEPIYETLPGWRGNISGCRRFEELPKEAQQYVKRVETLIGAPIKMVSVGPERTATIMR